MFEVYKVHPVDVRPCRVAEKTTGGSCGIETRWRLINSEGEHVVVCRKHLPAQRTEVLAPL